MKTAFFQTIYFPNINAPTGPTSPGLTAAFAVNTQGSPITVASGGTPIPLPNEQVLPSGVTTDSEYTEFTVAEAGTYRISYHVNTTLALPMGTRLMINGVDNIASTIAPKIATSRFENQITVYLPANATISLQMYLMTLAGDAVLAGGGAGASLTIIRLNGTKPAPRSTMWTADGMSKNKRKPAKSKPCAHADFCRRVHMLRIEKRHCYSECYDRKNGEGVLDAAGVLLERDRKSFLALDPAVSVVMAPTTLALMRAAG